PITLIKKINIVDPPRLIKVMKFSLNQSIKLSLDSISIS
ncbi:uncharacterized protein METZ01_LOCUS430624, partial [marine metagenome]